MHGPPIGEIKASEFLSNEQCALFNGIHGITGLEGIAYHMDFGKFPFQRGLKRIAGTAAQSHDNAVEAVKRQLLTRLFTAHAAFDEFLHAAAV